MLADKIKKLIDDTADEFGFIKDLEIIIEFLRKKNIDSDTIAKILNEIVLYNKKVTFELSQELRDSEILLSQQPFQQIQQERPIIETSKSPKKKTPSLKFILSIIDSTPIEELINALTTNNINNEIINYTLIHYFKLSSEFKKQLQSEEDIEYREIILNEIKKNECIIEKLFEYRDQVKTIVEQQQEIQLAFIDEDIIDDFDKIPTELYKDFLLLLESIKNGNPKNVKKFATPVSNSAITEVRKNNNIRILFDKINASTYCVYCAFIKDEVNKQYMERLEHRSGKYFSQKQFLIDKLIEEDPLFIAKQQDIEKRLFEKLNPQKTKKRGVLPC